MRIRKEDTQTYLVRPVSISAGKDELALYPKNLGEYVIAANRPTADGVEAVLVKGNCRISEIRTLDALVKMAIKEDSAIEVKGTGRGDTLYAKSVNYRGFEVDY